MENELSCAIVRDLLPSYADGLTSAETTAAVRRHLAGCPDCGEALRLMKEPEPAQETGAEEIDYLKKVRRHGSRRALITGIVWMLLGLSLLAFRFFYVGYSVPASDVFFDISVEGSRVELTAHTLSSGLGISRITFSDSNGMVQVMVYTAPATFFNSGDRAASYDASCPVGRVRMDDLILWEDGVTIRPTAARLFAAANPHVGDMSANANIAAILGIAGQFGDFTNELQTSAQPYGWTLILSDKLPAPNEGLARDKMTAASCVMLATVDNLGYVTWRYATDAGEGEFTLTVDQASAFSGYDIKSCCDSVTALQALLQTLGVR